MRDLMSYLPEWYQNSRETVVIQESIQPEIDLIQQARDDLLAQLNPWTATWGVALWEDALGLVGNGTLSLDQRRANVAAKIRSRETTTPALVKEISETILGVPVTVTELYGDYWVEICFDAQGELPAGLDGLADQLDKIMPAHLGWGFLITMTPALYVGGNFELWRSVTLPVLSEDNEEESA